MMRKISRKVGFWLFMVTVAWYAVGNYALGMLNKHYVQVAHDQHNDAQSFPMQGIDTVQLNSAGNIGYLRVKVAFDANSTLATVVNKNLNLTVQGHADQGTLTLTAARMENRSAYYTHQIEVTLPVSVRKIHLDTGGLIHLSGQMPGQDSALGVTVANCASQLNVDGLSVGHVEFDVGCHQKSKSPSNNVNVVAEDNDEDTPDSAPAYSRDRASLRFSENTHVQDLEVHMEYGDLHYMSLTTPARIALELGDSASVQARPPFFQIAKIEPFKSVAGQ